MKRKIFAVVFFIAAAILGFLWSRSGIDASAALARNWSGCIWGPATLMAAGIGLYFLLAPPPHRGRFTR